MLFVALGANSIWDANEAFYVETPRQMVLTGDYVSPTFNDAPRHNKPVLSYWIVAGLYQLFGISVGVERLGIALGALGIVGVTFLLARALGASQATAWWAALIVVTAPRFVMFSRRIFIDIYITLFMAAALACLAQAVRHPERRTRWLLCMWVSLGLGALTKGPVALVLPAAVLIAWLMVERRLGLLRQLMLVPGALIVLAILAPWGIAMHAAHGPGPLLEFIGVENLDRFAESVSGSRPFWFFLPVLFGDLFPWAPLALIPIVWTGWRGRLPVEDTDGAGVRRLLWCWVVVIVGAFSLSASKQDLYIFPVMPAVAVLVADALAKAASAPWRRVAHGLLAGIGVACAMLGVGGILVLDEGYYALRGITVAGAIVAAAGLAVFGAAIRGRVEWAMGLLAVGFIGFNYVFVSVVLPDAERLKPIPPIAATFKARAAPGARLGGYGTMLPSLVFYAGQPVREQPDLDQAVNFMTEPGDAWMIVEREEWDLLRARVPDLCVAERRHLFGFNEKAADIIRGIPPPELLLVTRCER